MEYHPLSSKVYQQLSSMEYHPLSSKVYKKLSSMEYQPLSSEVYQALSSTLHSTQQLSSMKYKYVHDLYSRMSDEHIYVVYCGNILPGLRSMHGCLHVSVHV